MSCDANLLRSSFAPFEKTMAVGHGADGYLYSRDCGSACSGLRGWAVRWPHQDRGAGLVVCIAGLSSVRDSAWSFRSQFIVVPRRIGPAAPSVTLGAKRGSNILIINSTNSAGKYARRVTVLVALMIWIGCGEVSAQTIVGEAACGRSQGGSLGWLDYRDPANASTLRIVNSNHFNADVQELVRGQTSTEVLADLDFVLGHFPNHPAALQAMTRYFLQNRPQRSFLSAECYFDRAVRANPDDIAVRQIFAVYLSRKGRYAEAIKQLEVGIELHKGPSMELHYNLGLLFAESGDFDKANFHASVAYGMGHPLPGLRDMLIRLGQWRPQEVPDPAETAEQSP